MTPTEAHRAINARWHSLWPGLSDGIAYSTDNTVMPEGNGYFARLAVISLDTEQHTLGPAPHRWWTHQGTIEVRLSGPVNVGRDPMDILAGHVRQIYQGVRIGRTAGEKGVVTEAMSIAEVRRGVESTGKWLLLCTTPFSFVEIS